MYDMMESIRLKGSYGTIHTGPSLLRYHSTSRRKSYKKSLLQCRAMKTGKRAMFRIYREGCGPTEIREYVKWNKSTVFHAVKTIYQTVFLIFSWYFTSLVQGVRMHV